MDYGIVVVIVAIIIIIFLIKTAVIVPQQSAYVVERLGQYSNTLNAGFHILIPFIDRISYRHSLKERALDTLSQICITKDNVQVEVDGVLYLQIMDPRRTSYGIANYELAIIQLAQTTLRSEFGKLELDRTFEERAHINSAVVRGIDEAAEPWGVKVLRYEIKDIMPPREVLSAMEKQMRAEREKRAAILESEGQRDSEINRAEGQKQRVIKESEAKKQQQINEAEGQAAAIWAVAEATAKGIKEVAQSLDAPGGNKAMELKIAEHYLNEFGKVAKAGNTIVLPASLSDVGSMITLAKGMLKSEAKAE
ncbi:MAG: paraslipin [Deltaproteobacteria bacterium]|nr:paraslipin [Deltaproteobacteria bacterium]